MSFKDYALRTKFTFAVVLSSSLLVSGCLTVISKLAPDKDAVAELTDKMDADSAGQSGPAWQVPIAAQETDFIQPFDGGRVLVGTIETPTYAYVPWALHPAELRMINTSTGESIWSFQRKPLGDEQTVVLTNPLIVVNGNENTVAIDPLTGKQRWVRPSAPRQSVRVSRDGRLFFLTPAKSSLNLSALAARDGSELWSVGLDKTLLTKDSQPGIEAFAETILVFGPELLAFSAADGKLLWRKPFPGKFGPDAAVIPLGNELYLTDGTALRRVDPAGGKEQWRADFGPGRIRNVTAAEKTVLVALRSTPDDRAPGSIQALDRATGSPLWTCDLGEQVHSAVVVDGTRFYVTTETKLIAGDFGRGRILFSSGIPAELQRPRLLYDLIQISGDRMVVARETGVIAVQKKDGSILYAIAVPDAWPLTYDYAAHRFSHAVESTTPPKQREVVKTTAITSTSDTFYRAALANQQFVYENTAEILRTGSNEEKRMALQERVNASKGALTATQSHITAGQVEAGVNVAASTVAAAQAIGNEIIKATINRRMEVLRQQMSHAVFAHAASLQDAYYLRPGYDALRGWTLTVVDLTSGSHSEILLSPHHDVLVGWASNLPAFAIDSSTKKVITKGLPHTPARSQTYKAFGIGGEWTLPYPSLLAFDLGGLRYDSAPHGTGRQNNLRPDQEARNERLRNAVFDSDIKGVEAALDEGAEVNAADEYGHTPLMLAAENLHAYPKLDVLKALLNRGADVTARDYAGWTAIDHWMIVRGDVSQRSAAKGLDLLLNARKERVAAK